MSIAFNDNRPFDQLKEQVRNDVSEWCEFYASFGMSRAKLVTKWSGDLEESMKQYPLRIGKYLQHSDPTVRLAAVLLLEDYCPRDERGIGAALRTAFYDADARVRGAAVLSLCAFLKYISDPKEVLAKLLQSLFTEDAVENRKSLRKVSDLLNRCSHQLSTVQASIATWQRETLESLAGPHLEAMLSDRLCADSFLKHADSQLREAAIVILSQQKAYADIWEKMAREDTAQNVRNAALTALIGCYANSDDRRIGEVLAKIVHDVSQSMDVRLNAYNGLFEIRGMPFSTFPINSFIEGKFRFPEDVDWSFVEDFRQNQ